jgi:hypothetical protein
MSPRLWLLVILALAGTLAPSRADAGGAETCAQGFFATATTARPESEPQVAGTHQGSVVCGYESASGYSQAAETTSIATPYAVEVQSASAEAQAALLQAQNGATLYRTGELGQSMAGESQYWSLQNPLSPGYANGMGMPNVQPNFIMTGTLNQGAEVITNEAAGLGTNAGNQIQIVTQPGGVGNLGFHMP